MNTSDIDFKNSQLQLLFKISVDTKFLSTVFDIKMGEVTPVVSEMIFKEMSDVDRNRLVHIDVENIINKNWDKIEFQLDKSISKFGDLREKIKNKKDAFWSDLSKNPVKINPLYYKLFFLPHFVSFILILLWGLFRLQTDFLIGILPETLFDDYINLPSLVIIFGATITSHLLYKSLIRKKISSENDRVNKIIKSLNIKSLYKELEKEREEILRAYVRSASLVVKEQINRLIDADWSLKLTDFDSRNFYISNELYAIDTNGLSNIRELLSRIDGGAIGLSGRRGIGKSTLLNAIVGEDQIAGNKRLSIMLSVPTVYESRQFLLYLISVFCKKILERSGSDKYSKLDEEELNNNYKKDRFLRSLKTYSIVGVTMAVTAILISYMQVSVLAEANSTLIEFLGNLGITSKTIFIIGITIIISSLIADKYLSNKKEDIEQGFILKSDPMDYGSLVNSARNWLQLTKYQQTYTSGWGGAIKNIGPIELKSEQAISFSQYQLTFPELISSFKELVKLASDEYEVIIALDELDKLESDERAINFLNEIKGLFGLRGVYYLISISESALISFESRGFFKRDVFDSSFDHVIKIPRLELKESVSLIHRRVIGLPIVFIALCHVLSAGIPRELIRNCRDIANYLEKSNRDIKSISERVICEKISQTVQFINNHKNETTKNIDNEQLEVFFEQIERLSNVTPSEWQSLDKLISGSQIFNLADTVLFTLSQMEIFRRLWQLLNIDDIDKLDKSAVEKLSKLKYESEVNPKKVIKKLLSEN